MQKRKIQTQTFCVSRVRLFSSSAQVCFSNTAINLFQKIKEPNPMSHHISCLAVPTSLDNLEIT